MRLAVVALLAIGCGGQQPRPDPTLGKHDEILSLWVQIRDWRQRADMDLDPSPQMLFQWRGKTVREAARVCSDGHAVPKTCDDVCNLADAICDNAEAICGLADELGKADDFAQQKCASAKASCREAKQRCCQCSEDHAIPEPGTAR